MELGLDRSISPKRAVEVSMRPSKTVCKFSPLSFRVDSPRRRSDEDDEVGKKRKKNGGKMARTLNRAKEGKRPKSFIYKHNLR